MPAAIGILGVRDSLVLRSCPAAQTLIVRFLSESHLVALLDLAGADLAGADLVETNLSGAALVGANLSQADVSQADLTGADLSGAILRGAKGTARAQLDQAKSLQGATAPDGSTYP